MTPKVYRFYFDKGVPVYDWPTGKVIQSYSWRRGKRTIPAHSMTEAIRKLAKPVIERHGNQAKLNLTKAWSRVEGNDWKELSLDAATISAFVVGMAERELLKLT